MRGRKDYVDGGLVGPSTSESVTGYGSREQWAAVGTGRCGRGWNLLNKELGARPGPGLYYMGVRMVMGGAGWGGDCVTRHSCFRSCYNLCSCAYPSHPMNWCFVGAKKV